MIRRLLSALALAVLTATLVVPVASAAKPTKATQSFAGNASLPAGTVCDFDYSQTYAGTDEITYFADRTEVHEKLTVVHMNVGTGYTLTESDQINYTFYQDGSQKLTGVFWHLRDSNGKVVVVHSGQVTYDPVGNIVKFTPNSSPDFAAVICPALGGNPAP